MNFILAEDDTACRMLIERTVLPMCDRFDSVDNTDDLLVRANELTDAIWLDLGLVRSHPETTISVIPKLRERCPKATLVIVTGYGEMYRQQALKAGADMYAQKSDVRGFNSQAMVQLLGRASINALDRGVNSSQVLARVAEFVRSTYAKA